MSGLITSWPLMLLLSRCIPPEKANEKDYVIGAIKQLRRCYDAFEGVVSVLD